MGMISGFKGPLYYLYDLCTCVDLFRPIFILSCFKERKTNSINFSPTTVTKFLGSTVVGYFRDKTKINRFGLYELGQTTAFYTPLQKRGASMQGGHHLHTCSTSTS